MKYLLIALLALTACSKSKVDSPVDNTIKVEGFVTATVHVSDTYRRVDIAVNFSKPVTTTGDVTVEWDEFSGSTNMGHKSATVHINANNVTGTLTPTAQTRYYANTAKNMKVTMISLSGSYQFKY